MIELVLVLVMVMILSRAVVSAITNSINRIRLENASDKVASDIRYAQYMSTSTAVWHAISFETTPTNRYTVYTTTATADATVKDPADQRSNYIVNLSTVYGTSISTVTVETGVKKLEFSPSGAPYTDRTTAQPISSESVVTLSNNAGTRTVRVTPRTGRVYQQ